MYSEIFSNNLVFEIHSTNYITYTIFSILLAMLTFVAIELTPDNIQIALEGRYRYRSGVKRTQQLG